MIEQRFKLPLTPLHPLYLELILSISFDEKQWKILEKIIANSAERQLWCQCHMLNSTKIVAVDVIVTQFPCPRTFKILTFVCTRRSQYTFFAQSFDQKKSILGYLNQLLSRIFDRTMWNSVNHRIDQEGRPQSTEDEQGKLWCKYLNWNSCDARASSSTVSFFVVAVAFKKVQKSYSPPPFFIKCWSMVNRWMHLWRTMNTI